jgi:hypothetical protein
MGVAAHQVFIDGDVLSSHPPGGEAALETASHVAPPRAAIASESAQEERRMLVL